MTLFQFDSLIPDEMYIFLTQVAELNTAITTSVYVIDMENTTII